MADNNSNTTDTLQEDRSRFLLHTLTSIPSQPPSEPSLLSLFEDLAKSATWKIVGEGGLSSANLFSVHLPFSSSSSVPSLPSEFDQFKDEDGEIFLIVKESPFFFEAFGMCVDLWREPSFYLSITPHIPPSFLLTPQLISVEGHKPSLSSPSSSSSSPSSLPSTSYFSSFSSPSSPSSSSSLSRVCMANALKKGSQWKVPGILEDNEAKAVVTSLARFHALFAHQSSAQQTHPLHDALSTAQLPFIGVHLSQVFDVVKDVEVTEEKIKKFAPMVDGWKGRGEEGEGEGEGAKLACEYIRWMKESGEWVKLGERVMGAGGDESVVSVVHLDVRSANMFVRHNNNDNGDSDDCEVMFYDWQATCIGPSMFDLAYLFASLSPPSRTPSPPPVPSLLSLYHQVYTQTSLSLPSPHPPIPSLSTLFLQFRAAFLWPVLWAARSLHGPQELAEGLIRDRPLSLENALEFLTRGAQRQLLWAMEYDALGAWHQLANDETTK